MHSNRHVRSPEAPAAARLRAECLLCTSGDPPEPKPRLANNGGYCTRRWGLTPASRRLCRPPAAEPPRCTGSHTLRRTNVSVSAKTRERADYLAARLKPGELTITNSHAQRDKLAWAEAAQIAGAPDPVAMVIIANDDSVGFYDYVLRCPKRVGYIRGDHSAETPGRSIAAVSAAVQVGNR
jgi:hypothetical protein